MTRTSCAPTSASYNASALGTTAPCTVTNPVFGSNILDTAIDANGNCQHQVLVNSYKSNFKTDEGQHVGAEGGTLAGWKRKPLAIGVGNPRVYMYNVGFEQQVKADYVAFADFTLSKGIYLTCFLSPNVGPTVIPANSSDTVSYSGNVLFGNLGAITETVSNSKSLYRGLTLGLRKRFLHHFQFEAQYTLSVDRDDDANERDPFTFWYANLYNLASEYS